MEQLIFSQLAVNRTRTLEQLAGVTEKEADVVPDGFNNSIRWHTGHILLTQERLSFRLIGEPLDLPELYTTLFVNGTKPADWQIEPPSMDEMISLLKDQPERIQKRLQGKLQTELTIPFKDLTRLEEALVFSLGHEAMHAGFIWAMKKAVAALA